MKTTKKWLVGAGIAAVAALGAYFLFGKKASAAPPAKIVKKADGKVVAVRSTAAPPPGAPYAVVPKTAAAAFSAGILRGRADAIAGKKMNPPTDIAKLRAGDEPTVQYFLGYSQGWGAVENEKAKKKAAGLATHTVDGVEGSSEPASDEYSVAAEDVVPEETDVDTSGVAAGTTTVKKVSEDTGVPAADLEALLAQE